MKKRAPCQKRKIEKSRFNWFLWLIPMAAALLCAWYVCQDIIFVGPTITIYFQNAEGLQEQTSLVQYRGVKIGEVETLKLTQDRQRVASKRNWTLPPRASRRKARFFGSFDPSSNWAR
jgi:paraquat-inducible protein B